MALKTVGISTNLSVMDNATGEVLPLRIITLKPEQKADSSFCKVFNAFAEDIFQDQELAGKPIRLLFYILKQLDINEIIVFLEPQEVIKQLNISRATFYRWLDVLLKKQILFKTKAQHVYILNPAKVLVGSFEKIKLKLPKYAKIWGIKEEDITEIIIEAEFKKRK